MKPKKNLKVFVTTAMLAAVAGVLMSLEVSVPLMPPFYKLDFSDVPTLIGLFAYGPWSALAIEVLKIVIKLFTVGTNSAYVGELANLIGAFLFIFPIWWVYRGLKQTRTAGKVALCVSVPIRVAVSCAINAFITLPLYAKATGMDMNTLVRAVAGVNPSITDLRTFIVLATVPFNLLKDGLNAVIGYLLYATLEKVHVFEKKPAPKAGSLDWEAERK